MITAAAALQLAEPTNKDIALARDAMKEIDQHIRRKMTFAGPEPFEIQPREMSYAAAKIVALVMKQFGWNVNASLGVKQGTLGGSTTIWQFLFSPVIEVYEAAITEMLPSLETPALDS